MVCKDSVTFLAKHLNPDEVNDILRLAKKTQTIEDKWRIKVESFFKSTANQIAEEIERGLTPNLHRLDFEDIFTKHAFDVMFEAMATTKKLPAVPERLAKYPKGPMPRSLKQLMELWDRWRNRGEVPKRQAKIAEKIKKSYIKKAQQVVGDYMRRIGTGEIISKKEIADQLINKSKMEAARAKTVVETETTRYWNTIRKNVYDESPDVTHYLFMAIRDAATTRYCKSRNGMVYSKDSTFLKDETPPIHYNCRSEILPLTPLNPRHKKLIDDKSNRREKRRPAPLIRGWKK